MRVGSKESPAETDGEDVNLDGRFLGYDPDGPQRWLFDTADEEPNAWEISFLKDVGYHAMGQHVRGMAELAGADVAFQK